MAYNILNKEKKESLISNPITLGEEQPLDRNLKPLKVGGVSSPIELALPTQEDTTSAKVKIVGDLEVTGDLKIRGLSQNHIGRVSTFCQNDLNIKTTDSGGAVVAINTNNGLTATLTPNTDTFLISGVDASTSEKGVVELATIDETNTGTDAARAVTPDGLDGWEGSEQIETVGEITTGSWNADTLGTGLIPALPTSKITSGTFADARIAASNVTQHQASITATGALNAGSITSGFTSIDTGSGAITTTGTLTGGNGVCQGTKHKHFVTGLHRMRASADDKWYGGRNQDYYKQSEIWSLATTADLSGNFTDTAASAWATFIYADFVAPADCTVTAFSASVYQNSASSDVTLALWKGVVADEDNHSGSAAVDFVSKIAVTANADTSSIHASLDGSAIDATAGNLNKGDILFLAFKRDEASGDAQYYYFNWGIELTYG